MHLIHPAVVHLALATIVLGGCCEAWALLTGRDALYRWASPLVLVGLASLVPTLVSGYFAANTLDIEGPARELLEAHERNGWILLVLLLCSQFWKAWCGGQFRGRQAVLYACSMLALVGLAVYGGWLGGRMVYGLGVGVAAGP